MPSLELFKTIFEPALLKELEAKLAAPQPPVEGLREALEPWRDELTEIIGHLGAAIHLVAGLGQ